MTCDASESVPKDERQHRAPAVAYVCLLSDYTVASAQAIKQILPAQVIAVSSEHVRRSGNEERFRSLLHSWRVSVQVIGSGPPCAFPAERMTDSRRWLDLHLCPLLEAAQRQGLQLFANLTGSTKAAAIALKECWAWNELHYTAEGTRARIEVLDRGVFSIAPLGLLEEARLLNVGIRADPEPWQGTDPLRLREAAETLYADYSHGAAASVLHGYDALLRELWFGARPAERLAAMGVSLAGNCASLPPGPLASFLAAVSIGDPAVTVASAGGLCIPASKTHRWSRFVSGGWWEFLVAAWIAELKRELVPHVVIPREGARSDDLEADILVRCRTGEMRAIECKVQPPGRSGFMDMVKLLNDLSHRFGKTRGGFAISPAFWWQVDTQTRDAFAESCATRRIDILDSQEAVERWVDGSDGQAPLPPYEIGR